MHAADTLDMFGPGLRELLYGKGSPGEKAIKQARIEGVDEISDLPSLTATGQNLMTLNWGGEQSGCTVVVDYGTVKIGFRFHAPVDHLSPDSLGRLHLMHQRDVKITLVGPVIDQAALGDEDTGDSKGHGHGLRPRALQRPLEP